MKTLRCAVLNVVVMALCHTSFAAVLLFEGFNQGSVPAGWTVSNPTWLSFVTSSTSPTASPYEGTHFVKFNSYNATAGTRSLLTAPAVSTLGKTNALVVFAWHRDPGYSSYQDRVLVQWSLNGTAWTTAGTYVRYVAGMTNWTIQTCALPGGATNQPALYVRFEFVSEYGNNCYLDAVQIKGTAPGEVDPPLTFTAIATGATNVVLSWQTNTIGSPVLIASNTTAAIGTPSNGVAYSVGDTLPGGGGVLYHGTDVTLPLSGLQPATRYYFKAWSVGSVTQYSDGVTADATTDFVLPIVEGFNSTAVPNGWSISNSTRLYMVTTSSSPTATPYEGTHFVVFNSYFASAGTRALLTSPRFSTQGGLVAVFVDFAWHQDPGYTSDYDSVTVQWSSNGTHWTSVQTFTRPAPETGWKPQRVRLPAAALGHPRAQVRFNFLSAYGNNCYLDAVQIVGAVPNVYLSPALQSSAGAPGTSVTYPLNLLNLTGGSTDVNLTYASVWPANGPAATGVLTNNGSTNFTVQVQVPTDAIASQVCTTLVRAVTADNQFTNTALLVTTCTWTTRPICEWFEAGMGSWANYFEGGVNGGWYWNSFYEAAAHDQETGGTNWLVSPAIDLHAPWAERMTLSFWFGIAEDLLYSEGVYLVTGNRNPALGHKVWLGDIAYDPGRWHLNELDVMPYRTNVPVYLAFPYISTNPWQLISGVCINAIKTGVDDARLMGPAAHPAMTSYGTTLAITGGMYAAGETGTNGPAPLTTAQLGFGPQGTQPNDANWTWFPATYLGSGGPGGDYDLYTAAPQITIAGALHYCYRFRRGTAAWVYGDLNSSSGGFDTNACGVVNVAMLPPHGALLRNQTIALDWAAAPSSFSDQTLSPPAYWETADDLTLPYDAYVTSVRMGGLYWNAGRQNLEQGFWLRIYANAVTNPGTLLHQQYVPGYACEELIGEDGLGFLDYKYHIDLSTQLLVQAGQTIWLSLQHEVQNDTRWSLLDTSDAVRGNSACQTGVPTAWNALGVDLGMEVYGEVTNAGYIAGSVRDAESLNPIAGAQVLITNAAYVNTVVTEADGSYVTAAPGGTYDLTVTKANYLPATAAGVAVIIGQTNVQHFLLEGSYLSVAPTNIARTMLLGQQAVTTLTLSNSGPLAVQYTVSIGNYGAATTMLKRITHVSLPPSDGNFPRGTAPLSIARAPKSSASAQNAAPAALAPLSPAVRAYGFNIYPADPNALISLMTDNPGAYTTVGTANTGPNGFVCGAAFRNNDFSTLYCLVYDDNKLVTVNTLNAAVTDIAACVPPSGEDWTGLAAAPNGTLFAVSSSGSVSKLYTINPTTGAATLVGQVSNGGLIIGIAINAAGDMYGVDIAADTLVRIDKTTGAGTVVGSIGFDANYAQDLAFDKDNNVLYLAAYNNSSSRAELRVADTATGNTTNIGQFSASALQIDGFETMTSGGPSWARVETNAGAIAAGSVGTLDVTFDASVVSNIGDYTAELVLDGTFVNPLAPVPLKMSIAAGPIISAPAALNFGQVVIGETTNLPLVIGNVGIGVLSGQITAVTAPFSISGADSYAIPAGSTSVHTLTFAPSVEGAYTNTATLTGGGGATVTLLGTGIPEPAVWLAVILACGLARRRR